MFFHEKNYVCGSSLQKMPTKHNAFQKVLIEKQTIAANDVLLRTWHAKAKQLSFTCNGMQQEKELAEFCDVEDRCISTDLPTIFSHWLNSEKKANVDNQSIKIKNW